MIMLNVTYISRFKTYTYCDLKFERQKNKNRKGKKNDDNNKKIDMPGPGFEPGLLRPQRSVLTTRRSRRATEEADE